MRVRTVADVETIRPDVAPRRRGRPAASGDHRRATLRHTAGPRRALLATWRDVDARPTRGHAVNAPREAAWRLGRTVLPPATAAVVIVCAPPRGKSIARRRDVAASAHVAERARHVRARVHRRGRNARSGCRHRQPAGPREHFASRRTHGPVFSHEVSAVEEGPPPTQERASSSRPRVDVRRSRVDPDDGDLLCRRAEKASAPSYRRSFTPAATRSRRHHRTGRATSPDRPRHHPSRWPCRRFPGVPSSGRGSATPPRFRPRVTFHKGGAADPSRCDITR